MPNETELEHVQVALGNIARSTDDNPWIVVHKRLLEAIPEAWPNNPQALEVVGDLVQTVAVLNQKLLDVFAATAAFLGHQDNEFEGMVSKQKGFIESVAEHNAESLPTVDAPVQAGPQTRAAIARLSDATLATLRTNYAEYLSQRSAVRDLTTVAERLAAGEDS